MSTAVPQAADQTQTTPPPRQNGRGPGRPPGSKGKNKRPTADDDDATVDTRSAFELGWKDATDGKSQDFFDWLTQFTTDDWALLLAYVYRTAPTIDRRNSGRHINIGKYGIPFTRDTVLEDFGSGGYRIDLCAKDPVSGKTSRIGQHFFTILDMKKPPRVPAGDWTEDPENKTWQWCKEALEAEQAQSQANYRNPGADPNRIFDTVLTGIERLRGGGKNDENSHLATELARGMNNMQSTILQMSDPAKQIQMIQAMISLMPKPAESGGDFQRFLMTEYAAMRAEVTAARTQKQPGFLEQLESLLPVVEKVTGFFGGKRSTATAAGTDWGAVVTTVIEKVSDNVPTIVSLFKGTPPPPLAQFKLNGPKPAAPAAGANGPDPAAGAQQTQQEAPNMTADEQTRFTAFLQKWGMVLQSVSVFMIDQFKNNLTGYDFRDWFTSRQTVANYNAFKLDITAADLFKLIQSHDALAAQLQPPDRLLEFLNEFYTEPGKEPEGVTIDPEVIP